MSPETGKVPPALEAVETASVAPFRPLPAQTTVERSATGASLFTKARAATRARMASRTSTPSFAGGLLTVMSWPKRTAALSVSTMINSLLFMLPSLRVSRLYGLSRAPFKTQVVDSAGRFGYTRNVVKNVKKKKTVAASLRSSLSYEPVELTFGTSGLRGLVKDITNLEAYVNVRGFLSWLLKHGEIRKGETVFAAGDLRPSTSSLVPDEGFRGEILQAACRAVMDAGLVFSHLGTIPTPALVLHAMRHSAPAIMVTGSHIPFDRNGLKFTRPAGEVMKADEPPILAAVAEARRAEYERTFEQSIFDERGMLKPESRASVPDAAAEAGEEYVRRYTAAFP